MLFSQDHTTDSTRLHKSHVAVLALKSKDADEWQKACQYEIDTLHKNDTWELVDLPTGHKEVQSQWLLLHLVGGKGIYADP